MTLCVQGIVTPGNFPPITLYLNMPKINCPVSDSRNLNQNDGLLSRAELGFLLVSHDCYSAGPGVCRDPPHTHTHTGNTHTHTYTHTLPQGLLWRLNGNKTKLPARSK